MINCPNCSKEIADESAHCGYCGHEIAASGEKRTMFGMAALDSAALQKAIKEAREQDESEAADEGKQKGLKLPTPTGKTGAAPTGGLPKPEPAAPSTTADDEDMSLAATEMLSFSPEDREALQGLKPEETSTPEETPAPELPDLDAAADLPTLMTRSKDDPFGPPGDVEAAPDTQDTQPHTSASDAPFGPTSFDDDALRASASQKETGPVAAPAEPAAPGITADNVGEIVGQPVAKKSNTKLFIIIGLIFLVLGGGCVVTGAYFAYQNFGRLSDQFGE